jgi:hypothetical protein
MNIRRYAPMPVALAMLVIVVSCNSVASHQKLVRDGLKSGVATVAISNAVPHDSHPWEVYCGQCGHDADSIGAMSAYPWLAVNDDGTASATATLSSERLVGGYHITVNASPTDHATIIACGNLAAASHS